MTFWAWLLTAVALLIGCGGGLILTACWAEHLTTKEPS